MTDTTDPDGVVAVLDRWGAEARSTPHAEVPLAAVGRRAARRRRRRSAVRLGAVVCAVALVVVAIDVGRRDAAPVVATASSTPAMIGTPVADPITAVDDGVQLDISPLGPLHANDRITISVPAAVAGDGQNNAPTLCFDWDHALACDPSAWMGDPGGAASGSMISWTRAVPGWVTTPDGLKTCRAVRCRVLYRGSLHDPVSSAVLDVAPGPKPVHRNASIAKVSRDGAVTVSVRTMDPRRVHDPYAGESPAFTLQVCAVAETTNVCDAVATPAKVPYDTSRHRIILRSTRDLFTTAGWIDCAKVACAVELRVATRIDQTPFLDLVEGDTSVAWMPFSLPKSAPRLRRPTLSVTVRGRDSPGTTVLATLRGPLGSADRITVQQCAEGFGNPQLSCTFGSVPVTAAGRDTYTAYVTLQGMSGSGELVARVGGEGYPPIAETRSFTVR